MYSNINIMSLRTKYGIGINYNTVSPFCEQNNMRAVNRMCEQFCACDSHACLSH